VWLPPALITLTSAMLETCAGVADWVCPVPSCPALPLPQQWSAPEVPIAQV
jgi:hypothetical protein